MDNFINLFGMVFCEMWYEFTNAIGLYALQVNNCAASSYKIGCWVILFFAYGIYVKLKK